MPLYALIDEYDEPTGINDNEDVVSLSFTMQGQRTPNWCWAATVASLEDYARWTTEAGALKPDLSNAQKQSTSQCVVAARDLDLETACCETLIVDGREISQVTVAWDVQNALSAPLNQAGLHERTLRGKPEWNEVVERITEKHMPVCCRIIWDDELRGAHFVVISAVAATARYVQIDDSLYGTIVVPFDSFLRMYQPNQKNGGGAKRGRITHTYYLRRPE